MKARFDSSGTEGMLDVVLGCTLIFILLTALVRVDEGTTQEVALPDIDLSIAPTTASGAEQIKRTVISISMKGAEPEVYIEDRLIPWPDLEYELSSMRDVGQVALRRDRSLTCEWEDKIIMLCKRAGVTKVAIILQAESSESSK